MSNYKAGANGIMAQTIQPTTNLTLSGIGAQSSVGAVGAQFQSSLTTSQLNKLASINMSNIFNSSGLPAEDYRDNSFVKKYTIYDLAEDVITLAVTNARIKEASGAYFKLTDPEMFKKITSEDREQSNIIREYYKKKFTYLSLTSTNRSNYRQDLLKLLNDDGKKIPEPWFGVAYYLPYFYEYDIQRDGIKSQVLTKGAKQLAQETRYIISNHTIIPMKRIHRKSKRGNFYEYWFKTENDYGLMVPVNTDNTLLGMIEYIFSLQNPIIISGKLYAKELDNFEYLTITNWSVSKI